MKTAWRWLTDHVHAFRHVYECGHLAYFVLVASHGPYYLAAGGLAIIGTVMMVASRGRL